MKSEKVKGMILVLIASMVVIPAIILVVSASMPTPSTPMSPLVTYTNDIPIPIGLEKGKGIETIVIPYQATGYEYKVFPLDEVPENFGALDFNDSDFLIGDAAFGSEGGCPLQPTVKTFWHTYSEIVLRKSFTLPAGAINLRVLAAVDNDIQVLINGVDISGGLVTHELCPILDDFLFEAPDSILREGENLLAVRARDRGLECYVDLRVLFDVLTTPTVSIFTDVASEYGVNDSHQGKATVWFDYDNDGDLDILCGGRLFKNDINATDSFTEVGSYGDSLFVDYDNDGDLDFYQTAFGKSNKIFRNDEEAGFVEIPGALGANDSRHSRSAVWGDYDNDGDMDLYVVNGRGERCSLYRNEMDTIGLFTDVTAEMNVGDTGRYANSASWGDYDNDGDLDLYLAKCESGLNRLYRNDVNTLGTFTEVGKSLGVADNPVDSFHASWGDYDNDGDLDLYVVNGVSKAPSRLYRNDVSEGNGFVKTGEMANAGSAMGGSWGDFDGDGDIDYYLVGSYPGYVMTNRLYQNNNSENGNHWLHINAIGTISNRAAIGTTIQVVAGDLTQLRYVESSSGYGSQNSLPVEFGLGAHSTVDSVIIKWPSGRVQNLTDVEVNQFLTVYEYTPGCIRQIPQESTFSTNLDVLFQLKINQIASIDRDNLKIKFLNITEDSRCPSDVVCFWEGQATIVVKILKNDQDLGDFSLTGRAGHEDLAVKNFEGYSIKLKKVEPYPKTTQKIELSDYIVTLIVSKI